MFFRKKKAYVNLDKWGVRVHSACAEHSVKMMTACALHLEANGYEVGNVLDAIANVLPKEEENAE